MLTKYNEKAERKQLIPEIAQRSRQNSKPKSIRK